jgi:hypothetical protein
VFTGLARLRGIASFESRSRLYQLFVQMKRQPIRAALGFQRQKKKNSTLVSAFFNIDISFNNKNQGFTLLNMTNKTID